MYDRNQMVLNANPDDHEASMRSKSPLKREPVMPELHCAVPDQRRLLAASPYFHSLDAAEIEEVQRRFTQRHYLEGSTIHLMGAPAKRLSIVALGTANIALMNDDPMRIVDALRISRKTNRVVRQNLAIALGTVALLLVGVLMRGVNMAGGMMVHEASVMIVIPNSMRLMIAVEVLPTGSP